MDVPSRAMRRTTSWLRDNRNRRQNWLSSVKLFFGCWVLVELDLTGCSRALLSRLAKAGCVI